MRTDGLEGAHGAPYGLADNHDRINKLCALCDLCG